MFLRGGGGTMNEKQFTISEVIDSFGITKHSWVLFIILSLAQVLDGYDFMIVNSSSAANS